jgi:hypothetical protein
MRTSVFVLLAVVIGYFAYNSWFAAETDVEPTHRLEGTGIDGAGLGETGTGGAGLHGAGINGARLEYEHPGNGSTGAAGDTSRAASGPQGLVVRPDLHFGDDDQEDTANRETLIGSADDARETASWKLYGERNDARNAEDSKKAAAIERRIIQLYADTDADRMLKFEKGAVALRKWRAAGRSAEGLAFAQQARKLLTPALFLRVRPVDPAQHDKLRRNLADLAHEVLFRSGALTGVIHLYKVRPGDALSRLCSKEFPNRFGVRTETGLILAMNNLGRAQDLRAGANLRVPAGKPSLVVVKSEFRLYYLLDGAYVRDWEVGLGAKGSTPQGTFAIESKVKNPAWFPKRGVKVPYGDPANILGTRWMGFKDTAELTGFGIHGTTIPESIGREESSGCVRMNRADVEEVFGWTPRGTKVEIRR